MSKEIAEGKGSGEKEMSFLEHLEELRWHIIRAAIAIVVLMILAFVFQKFIFHYIVLGPSRPDFWTFRKLCELGEWIKSDAICIEELPFIIQSRKMTGQFTMSIMVSAVMGLVIAFPYVFWEIWRFVRPGLYHNEVTLSRGAVFFVSLLFSMGILFGYFIVTPLAVNFLANYSVDASIQNEFDIVSYVSTVAMLTLACGIMFQLPIVVYFLTKVGVIGPATMRTYRKHSIVVILIISAIITPPDIMSQILIALPLLLLYEISIFISMFVARKEEAILADQETE